MRLSRHGGWNPSKRNSVAFWLLSLDAVRCRVIGSLDSGSLDGDGEPTTRWAGGRGWLCDSLVCKCAGTCCSSLSPKLSGPQTGVKKQNSNLLPLSPVSSDKGVTQGQKGNSPYMWNALATALEEKVHHLRAQVSLSAPKIVPRVLYMPGRPPTTELYSRPRRLLLRNVC